MQTWAIFYCARGTWQDRAIRALTGSRYSHCELVAPWSEWPRVETIAASKRDGNKVRHARIDLRSGHWDALWFPADPIIAWSRAEVLDGADYDTVGAVLSATALARSSEDRWFCSELIAHALGWREPCEFSPGMLAAAAMGCDS